MDAQPRIATRAAQPYVAVTADVRPDQLANAVDDGFTELFAWLARNGTSPAGAPFVRYIEVDMAQTLLVELGAPVTDLPPVNERLRAGTLPAGDYATFLHRGPYDELVSANSELLKWGEEHGVRWAMDGPTTWRARVEQYLTDPREESDPTRWETEIRYLIDTA